MALGIGALNSKPLRPNYNLASSMKTPLNNSESLPTKVIAGFDKIDGVFGRFENRGQSGQNST